MKGKRKQKLLVALLLGAGLLQGVLAGEYTNFIGMTFVDIPAGEFLMGAVNCENESQSVAEENRKRAFLGQGGITTSCTSSPNYDSEAGNDEAPVHRVTISAFQMGKYEVTLGQFKAYIRATGRTGLLTEEFLKYNRYDDNVPVVMVSWHDAKAFVGWLNQSKPGSDSSTYRLPSEAEWEYACKAGYNTMYCGGNDPERVGWYWNNSRGRPQAVGIRESNNFGLHDMSGNVWEWVEDCWHVSYHGAPSNNRAWTSGKCDARVRRGGSWNFDPNYLRAADRDFNSPGYRGNHLGFRLARTHP